MNGRACRWSVDCTANWNAALLTGLASLRSSGRLRIPPIYASSTTRATALPVAGTASAQPTRCA